MLAVTFHQNDNIRESAIQLPLVVDILQGEGRYEVSPQICNFVRFFGVRIVLGLVSGQIELDDGLPNTIFHVGLLAQVEATGNPPVFLAAVGCSTLDGDKGGNFEILKIILRNVRTRPGNHLDDRNVPLIHMAAAAGEVKRFVLGHLTFKHPLVFFVFQLELNRGSEVIRVIPIWAMRAACVLVELSHIDIWLDRDKNSPDVPFLRNLSSGKTVRQLPILLGFVGLCADAGDQIVWNCDVCQIRCQIKCWRGFLRQCRRWEQRQHHAAEQQDAEKSFSHGLVPPFSL